MKTKFIFIYSGKGGVGKSTISINLAYSLASYNPSLRVGLFDADLEAPSIPVLLKGLKVAQPMRMKEMKILPALIEGVKISSTGLINHPKDNLYLSGKMLEGALNQLLFHDAWDVDLLLIDLPPGTNEIHRQILSRLKGDVLLVTSPQVLSYSDTQRGIDFLKHFDVNILGIIENLSYHECHHCGSTNLIFKGNTDKLLAAPNKLSVIMKLPVMEGLGSRTEDKPFVLSNNNHPISNLFKGLGNMITSNSFSFVKG
ncbi:P-loop NTPase [Bacillus sp. MUM 13]|uniref:P-loop NTPase n=1 Tax=Bacillus sp. MUM 13 TaxID=1678001 RepID=UPI0008F5E1EC|nr:P-loop NTPase [Bacillus sp. MUM 13]OIK08262.1 hypothetical protein BIV59_20435 [Bacillus sp. MUM 13]